jgi:hypothetical protein
MSETHDAFSTQISVTSSGVVSGGHFVGVSNAEYVTSGNWIGVYASKTDSVDGEPIAVTVLGPVKVWADGGTAIAVGDFLAPDASGHAVKQASASTAVAGMALEALASGTAFIEMLVAPSQG